MYAKPFPRNALLAWLAAATLVIAASLNSAWAADPGKDRGEQWAQHRQEWVRAKLDRDANRLEIKASQQAAWQDYAGARKALAEMTFHRPAPDADAATIAKARADRAADAARKLAVLADATTKLQGVLSPDQRKTLDQIVHKGHHRHGRQAWRHERHGQEGGGQKDAAEPDQNEQAPSA